MSRDSAAPVHEIEVTPGGVTARMLEVDTELRALRRAAEDKAADLQALQARVTNDVKDHFTALLTEIGFQCLREPVFLTMHIVEGVWGGIRVRVSYDMQRNPRYAYLSACLTHSQHYPTGNYEVDLVRPPDVPRLRERLAACVKGLEDLVLTERSRPKIRAMLDHDVELRHVHTAMIRGTTLVAPDPRSEPYGVEGRILCVASVTYYQTEHAHRVDTRYVRVFSSVEAAAHAFDKQHEALAMRAWSVSPGKRDRLYLTGDGRSVLVELEERELDSLAL